MLASLFSFLDTLVLEYKPSGTWNILGKPPEWAFSVFPELFDSTISLPEIKSYFIENFLVDAERIWSSETDTSLASGPWIEEATGIEYPLEARAIRIGKCCILLIRFLGEEYSRTQRFFQQAREEILVQEVLEEEVVRRTRQIRDREDEMVRRLISAVEFRDDNTGDHVRRISLYSEALARLCRLSPEKVDELRLASTMHDVGKVGIPDKILLKPGKLTKDEFSIMKEHTTKGAAILEGSLIEVLKMAREIALYHHERWDGNGYPFGLQGYEIPQSARIVSIVDVFDALVSERPYKRAFTIEKACDILREDRGCQFDPQILDLFLDNLELFIKILNLNS